MKTLQIIVFTFTTILTLSGCGQNIINHQLDETKPMEGIDDLTIIPIPENSKVKIQNDTVYYGENPRLDIDAKTFQVINQYYAKDKNSGFVNGHRIEESDGDTFSYITDFYSKDKNAVYYGGRKIEGSDPNTFEFLNFQYSKDANYGYFDGNKIEGSDGASFEVMDFDYAKDKYNKYYFGHKIQVDKIED